MYTKNHYYFCNRLGKAYQALKYLTVVNADLSNDRVKTLVEHFNKCPLDHVSVDNDIIIITFIDGSYIYYPTQDEGDIVTTAVDDYGEEVTFNIPSDVVFDLM